MMMFWAQQACREDDTNWPKPNIVGKQELEIRIGGDHISFHVRTSSVYRVEAYGLALDRKNRLFDGCYGK
jgi:hypothetical protein